MSEPIYNVLFLCTGNTARSILAESILRKDGCRHFRAFSAGSQPKGTVNPLTIKVLGSLDYPTDDLRSKSWEEFARPVHPQWTSSLRFATTRRAKRVRCGPASR
jgi:arsenate reductase (thioredoxin)